MFLENCFTDSVLCIDKRHSMKCTTNEKSGMAGLKEVAVDLIRK